jgi:hypothetical protein
MNKNAKELFEELGFENTLNNNCLMVFERFTHYRVSFTDEVVQFHLNDKTFEINNIDEINIRLLQAINKQVEELWGVR